LGGGIRRILLLMAISKSEKGLKSDFLAFVIKLKTSFRTVIAPSSPIINIGSPESALTIRLK